jgi:hypothetical protein
MGPRRLLYNVTRDCAVIGGTDILTEKNGEITRTIKERAFDQQGQSSEQVRRASRSFRQNGSTLAAVILYLGRRDPM